MVSNLAKLSEKIWPKCGLDCVASVNV